MKAGLIAFGMLLLSTPAMAGGIVSKHASSVQLTVDAARSTATRIGSSFSISGSNVDTTDGSTANTVSAGTIFWCIFSRNNCSNTRYCGSSILLQSILYTKVDALPTSAPTVGDVPNFGSVTSYTAGTAGSLAGTVTSAGVLTVTFWWCFWI